MTQLLIQIVLNHDFNSPKTIYLYLKNISSKNPNKILTTSLEVLEVC